MLKYIVWYRITLTLAIFFFSSIGIAFEVTDAMVDEIVEAAKSDPNVLLLATKPGVNEVKVSRDGRRKGIIFDITCKSICLGKEVSIEDLRNEMINKTMQSKNINGLISWLWDGFYFKYRYHYRDLDAPVEIVLDRQTLYGQPLSELLQYQNNETWHKIAIPNHVISFFGMGTDLADDIAPGHPFQKTICDAQHNQEWYLFRKESLELVVSIFRISPNQPKELQVNCVIDYDLKSTSPDDVVSPYTIDDGKLQFNFRATNTINQPNRVDYSFHVIVDDVLVYFAFSDSTERKQEETISKIVKSIQVTDTHFIPGIVGM